MTTDQNTPTTAELLETLRKLLNLTENIDRLNLGERIDLTERNTSRLSQCVDMLESRLLSAEQDIATLTDRISNLCRSIVELREDLSDAVDERDTYKENAETAEDDLSTLQTLHEAATEEIHDRHPHLLDDLLDYTAHLRHTGADRKTIALMELTTATLRTISTLLN
jgi:chromosome segregation ATPase